MKYHMTKNISSSYANIWNITIKWPWVTDSNVSVSSTWKNFAGSSNTSPCRWTVRWKYWRKPAIWSIRTNRTMLPAFFLQSGGTSCINYGKWVRKRKLWYRPFSVPTREYLPIMLISAKTHWLSAPDWHASKFIIYWWHWPNAVS